MIALGMSAILQILRFFNENTLKYVDIFAGVTATPRLQTLANGIELHLRHIDLKVSCWDREQLNLPLLEEVLKVVVLYYAIYLQEDCIEHARVHSEAL